MKKVLLTTVVGTAMAMVPTLSANAWTYGITGNGMCQQDGSYKINWVVDNHTEPEDLIIKSSNNTSVVQVGTHITAGKTATYIQNADGTKADNFTLTLKGNWPSDSTKRTRTATVHLAAACTHPTPQTPPTTPTPPVGGSGGGQVLGAQTVVKQPAAQVVAPKGAVNAGDGNTNTSFNAFALFGFVGSLAAAGFGIRRFVKQSR